MDPANTKEEEQEYALVVEAGLDGEAKEVLSSAAICGPRLPPQDGKESTRRRNDDGKEEFGSTSNLTLEDEPPTKPDGRSVEEISRSIDETLKAIDDKHQAFYAKVMNPPNLEDVAAMYGYEGREETDDNDDDKMTEKTYVGEIKIVSAHEAEAADALSMDERTKRFQQSADDFETTLLKGYDKINAVLDATLTDIHDGYKELKNVMHPVHWCMLFPEKTVHRKKTVSKHTIQRRQVCTRAHKRNQN